MEEAEKCAMGDLSGRSIKKSNAGAWKAAKFIFALNAADFQASIGVPANLVPYLSGTMHQSISKAATITTNFIGTSYLLTVLGGFLADSYLGSFWTIAGGAVAMNLGLGLLAFSTAYSGLQPASCTSTVCTPAGARYMVPLYLALYTIALGTGLAKPNLIALGADQFDESSPVEKKQSIHFYPWFYFFTNIGLFLAFTLAVYLEDDVSRSWGYGYILMFYATCSVLFCVGTPTFRHRAPAGSFLTRSAQVLVASLLKRTASHDLRVYDPAPTERLSMSRKVACTNKLSFLDRAARIDDKDALVVSAIKRPNPWRLCSVSQVEETKVLLQMLPILASTALITLAFSQIITFVVQQGATLDRKLGPHFEVPPASLGAISIIGALVVLPIYDGFVVPFARRFTKHPYGFTPLQRLGSSIVFATLTMITAALVERKRLTYVRELHLEALPLGAYQLPMKLWWLIPQFFLLSLVELFYYVSSYEFYASEAAESTRSIGSSFTYLASSLGYYFSTILVKLVNRATRHHWGGGWLEGNLNNGGLEKFYWLLALLLAIEFPVYLAFANWYEYKNDWYHERRSPQVNEWVDQSEPLPLSCGGPEVDVRQSPHLETNTQG